MLKYKGYDEFSMDNWFYENLKDVMKIVEKKAQSFILANDGKTGLGKTTKSIQQAIVLSRGNKNRFNLNHILYDPYPSFEMINNSKKGDVWIFDESILFNSRSAMSRYNKSLLMLLSTIRSKQIYVILNIPSIFDLDRAIVLDKLNLLVHLYGDHFGDRGKYMVFDEDRIKQLYLYGKKTYSYSYAKSNFFATFSSKFLIDEKEYDKKKLIEVKKFMRDFEVVESPKIIQRDILVSYLNQKHRMSYKDIAELFPQGFGMSISGLGLCVNRVKERYNPKWFRNRIPDKEEFIKNEN